MATLDQQYIDVMGGGGIAVANNNADWYRAVAFTPTISGQVARVDIPLVRSGSAIGPAYNYLIGIWSDNAGLPFNLMGSATTVVFLDISTSMAWYSFNFSTPATVTAGTKYYVTFYRTSADAENYLSWDYGVVPPLGNYFASSGIVWTYNTSMTLGFKEYAETLPPLNPGRVILIS
jgi:hypothetical protein